MAFGVGAESRVFIVARGSCARGVLGPGPFGVTIWGVGVGALW